MAWSSEPHPGLLRRAIPLRQIARLTSRRDVLPVMATAARTRKDVIDRVGVRTAVLATMFVTGEDCSTRHSAATHVWHLHHVPQPDHRGLRKVEPLGMQHDAVVFEHFSLLRQHKTGSPAGRHDGQRLIAGIENERVVHGRTLLSSPHAGDGGYLVRSHSRHHCRYFTTSSDSGRCAASPYWVTSRNSR